MTFRNERTCVFLHRIRFFCEPITFFFLWHVAYSLCFPTRWNEFIVLRPTDKLQYYNATASLLLFVYIHRKQNVFVDYKNNNILVFECPRMCKVLRCRRRYHLIDNVVVQSCIYISYLFEFDDTNNSKRLKISQFKKIYLIDFKLINLNLIGN